MLLHVKKNYEPHVSLFMDTYYQVSNKVELKVKVSSVAVMANLSV